MTTVIELPYDSPPIRSNQRHHWRTKAKLVREVRAATKLVAGKVAPIAGQVIVSLIWTVPDRRIRDSGGPSPTLKAALDGIVDAGVLRADDSTVVTEERCRIEYRAGVRGVRVEIEAAT